MLNTKEKTKIERELKQKSKDLCVSDSPTSVLSQSTSHASRPQPHTTAKPTQQKPSLLEKFMHSVDKSLMPRKTQPHNIVSELTEYRTLAQKSSPISAMDFWREHGNKLPILLTMARRYLSTPGTSVASESAFSVSAYVARKERARLSAENLSYTVFLKDKLS